MNSPGSRNRGVSTVSELANELVYLETGHVNVMLFVKLSLSCKKKNGKLMLRRAFRFVGEEPLMTSWGSDILTEMGGGSELEKS